MALPYPLIKAGWKYGQPGPNPCVGINYAEDLKDVVYELWRVGVAEDFKIYGSKNKGLYSIRSRRLNAEVHNLWHATITEEGEWEKAEEVAMLLTKCFGQPSVQDSASNLIRKSKWLNPEMLGDMRFKTGYLGGIQWSPISINQREGYRLDNAYYSDLEEAYVNCMLKRQLPRTWEWSEDRDFPDYSLSDQDSLYWVEVQVPDYLPWGFPISRETIEGFYAGMATGEEILSAQLDPSRVKIYGKWVPRNWRVHPAAKILTMPRAVRKRVGITVYGLHAKREDRAVISIAGEPARSREYLSERYNDAYFLWTREHQARPFARLDYAGLTTSRVRSAVVRAALDMPEPYMVYVDGIVGDQQPMDDELWPHVVKWNLKAEGACTVWGPGVYHFDSGQATTKRGKAIRDWHLRQGQ